MFGPGHQVEHRDLKSVAVCVCVSNRYYYVHSKHVKAEEI